MASAVGPVPQIATRAPSKANPSRFRNPTQPMPSVLCATRRPSSFTSTFAPPMRSTASVRSSATSKASGL